MSIHNPTLAGLSKLLFSYRPSPGKMWRRKLLPLSCALRRATPRFASIHSISQQLETLESARVYVPLTRRPIVQPNLILSAAKNFSSRTAGDQFRCWNCKAAADGTVSFLVCESCRSVQPVNQSVDYFNIFGLDKKYEIEVGNLEGKYKGWQKKLHPDLVHTKSEKEREYAAEQSARVTDAYRTLIDPLFRAIYILRLAGVDVNEEETVSDPELLTEIMEIREAVEEAGNSQELNQIQIQVQQKLDNWSKCFANAFQGQKYEKAINSIQRMTYYKRANEEIVKRL